MNATPDSDPLECVDHLVMTSSSLASGIDELERLSGVRAAGGGRHQDWGSHNALISLGARAYLEVIAADPESRVPSAHRPEVFTRPGTGVLNGWVARVADIERAVARSHELGHGLGAIREGRRERPDGSVLAWRLTDPRTRGFDGLLPILIDWGDSPHPASSATPGCHLIDLEFVHPEAKTLSAVLDQLELPVTVRPGRAASIVATIETPAGRITLH